MSDGECRHLKANQGVLDRSSDVVRRVVRNIVRDCTQPHKNRKEEALPVGSKYDEFDAKEFWHGPERLQIVGHANPKQAQRVETERNANVVYNPGPQVSRPKANIAFVICTRRFQDDGCYAQDRFHPRVLEDSTLDSKERMRVRNVDFGENVIQRP